MLDLRRDTHHIAGVKLELLVRETELAPSLRLQEKFRFEMVGKPLQVLPPPLAARLQQCNPPLSGSGEALVRGSYTAG